MIKLIEKQAAVDVIDHYHELIELGVEDAYQKAKEELEGVQEYLPFAAEGVWIDDN